MYNYSQINILPGISDYRPVLIVATCAMVTAFMIFSLGISKGVSLAKSYPIVDMALISVDMQNGVRTYQGKPFTGAAIAYHSNGERAELATFKQGKRNGSLKKWFDNGRIGFDSNYLDGRQHGLTASWWRNGNRRSEANYINGRAHGMTYSWYRSGEPFKQFNYKLGHPAGIQQAWRKTGELFANFEYKNGRTYGLKKSVLCVELSDEKIIFN